MRKIILATVAFVLSAGVAWADDVMASRYGNTTIATDPSGTQQRVYYKPDGTFTGKQGDLSFSGTWKVNASNIICLTFVRPLPGLPNPLCTPVTAHKVGDTWGAGGRVMTLMPGIH
jgi:hypothetical protein